MRTFKRFQSVGVLILVSTILLISCSKDDEIVFPVSFLSFDYSGYLNGSYSAIGEESVRNYYGDTSDYASGSAFKEGGLHYLLIGAQQYSGPGNRDILQLELEAPKAGNYRIPGYDPFYSVVYNVIEFNYNTDSSKIFYISGHLELSTLTLDRAIGTFNGSAKDDDGNTITISDGKFNVDFPRVEVPSK
jgi:hypothetical protein